MMPSSSSKAVTPVGPGHYSTSTAGLGCADGSCSAAPYAVTASIPAARGRPGATESAAGLAAFSAGGNLTGAEGGRLVGSV